MAGTNLIILNFMRRNLHFCRQIYVRRIKFERKFGPSLNLIRSAKFEREKFESLKRINPERSGFIAEIRELALDRYCRQA